MLGFARRWRSRWRFRRARARRARPSPRAAASSRSRSPAPSPAIEAEAGRQARARRSRRRPPARSAASSSARSSPAAATRSARAAARSHRGCAVHDTKRSAPPNTTIYNQTLPAGGYGYLTTRDGTSSAINVHLPGPADAGPYPTLVEYSGYGYANPGGGESSIEPIARAARLRGRRRQHARHRLLGRRLRLLRAAAGPRRLRRDRDRRPPALGRSTTRSGCSASPTAGSASCSSAQTRPPSLAGDHAAVGDRQHPDDALSGRHPQHRLRARVGGGPRPRRRARRPRPAARRGR